MSHPKAKLTPQGRALVVKRVMELGWTPAQTAEAVGVSRATVYRWLRRFRQEGEAGLLDRSSRPHHHARALGDETRTEILRLRVELRLGPHQLAPRLGVARSTIYGVLRRHGLSRLSRLDRTTREVIRYERAVPGELIHLDTKKLARIPQGGGHRKLGRSQEVLAEQRRQRAGYEFVHVAVDDCTRLSYLEVLPDERGTTAAAFLARACRFFGQRRAPVREVLTDRAFAYTRSHHFKAVLTARDLKHRTTRPYRPQTNGKAERFIRTLLNEWAYADLYLSDQARLDALQPWLSYYNGDRPHTALGGSSPMSFLVNKVGGKYR